MEIEWLGKFEDLVLGTDEFATEVRTRFKEGSDASLAGEARLMNEEIPAFVEFLQGYGV